MSFPFAGRYLPANKPLKFPLQIDNAYANINCES